MHGNKIKRIQQLTAETVCLCLIADGERLANKRWDKRQPYNGGYETDLVMQFFYHSDRLCHVMLCQIISYHTNYRVISHIICGHCTYCVVSYCPWWGLNHYRFVIVVVVYWLFHWMLLQTINPLTPNDHYRGRTAPLTSKRCILYIYSTDIGTEYFKHGIYSLFFFSLQNAVCFIILTYLVPVLFTFYIQGVLK